MTKREIKELVAACDYPELQKLWKHKVGDEFYFHNTISVLSQIGRKNEIFGVWNSKGLRWQIDKEYATWLPRIEDVIFILADKHGTSYANFKVGGWIVDATSDKSPRLACLLALKSVLTKK